MLSLRPTRFEDIAKWFVDFQKKSRCFELPTDEHQFIGIYLDDILIGYFVLFDYRDGTLEITQGYLKPIARHKQLSYDSMRLLEEKASRVGFRQIILKASRTLKAYTKFMGNLGFKPESIIYSKRI